MVWRHGLLNKIYKLGVRGHLFTFIERFITGRTFTVNVGGALSAILDLENGIPQGSVISPTLFNIFINDLAMHMTDGNQNEINILSLGLFADDTAFWRVGKNFQNLNNEIQKDLNNLQRWAESWGVTISSSKTVAVHFSKTRINKRKPDTLTLFLDNKPVRQDQTVRFLGVTFDRGLTFKPHITDVTGSCSHCISLLRVLSGSPWGSDRKTLLMIFEAYIVSRLQYGSQALANASPAQLKRLDVVYDRALRIISGVNPTTPTDSLHAELGILPLSLRRMQAGIKYIIKLRCLIPNNPVSGLKDPSPEPRSFVGLVDKQIKDFQLAGVPLSTSNYPVKNKWALPQILLPFCIKDELSNISNSNPLFKQVIFRAVAGDVYNDFVHVYTDGSKDPDTGKTGMAIYIESSSFFKTMIIRARLSDKISVFTTELMAISEALNWIEAVTRGGASAAEKFVIFSDSLSSLQAVGGANSARPDLVGRIIELNGVLVGRGLTIVYEWVPAHIGIPGNETADRNAKKCLSSDVIHRTVPLGHCEFFSLARRKIIDIWQTSWDEAPRLWHFYIKPNVDSRGPVSHSVALTRLITRLRVGVARGLGAYKARVGWKTSQVCKRCGVLEDVRHFILDCPIHRISRVELTDKLKNAGLSFSINNLFNPPTAVKKRVDMALFEYVHSTETAV